MNRTHTSAERDPQAVEETVLALARELTAQWDLDFAGGIRPHSHLSADLGLESIQIVRLLSAIQDRFRSPGLPFQRLFFPDGQTVVDPTVADVARFLSTHLTLTTSPHGGGA